MDQNVIFPILDWLGNRLRPRNLYTSNWLGTGHVRWSQQKRQDGKGLYYHLCIDVEYVVGCPIMQACPGDDAIGFYENDIDAHPAKKLILNVGDPDFFQKLSVFSWENTTRHRFTEGRLSYGPKEGFKPVVWETCRVTVYPWADPRDIYKPIFEGVDLAI